MSSGGFKNIRRNWNYGIHQLLIYVTDVNLFDENVNTIQKI
jgi:hypothetical protein